MFFCYHCYAASEQPAGPCAVCGKPVELPVGLSRLDILIWGLGHPNTHLAVLAARALGRVKARESIGALRSVFVSAADISLRAEALLSLIAIEGPEERPWLEELSRARPLPVSESGGQHLRLHFEQRAAATVPPMSDAADRWTFCSQGHIHWGANGGAGLLLRYEPVRGQPEYLLTERSRWVDEGGTWGIPGGAIHDGESVEAAARRETAEEIWPLPPYRITGIDVQDCGGGWKFHIVRADVSARFAAYSAKETDATGWFTMAQMNQLRMHPGFREWVQQNSPGDRPTR